MKNTTAALKARVQHHNALVRGCQSMNLVFEMPNVGSWNGKWSGEDDVHLIIKPIRRGKKHEAEANQLAGNLWRYQWSDGWSAQISARIEDASAVRKLRAKNKGFCGYDWMVENILDHGSPYRIEKARGQ